MEVGTWIWKWDAPVQMRSSNLSISLCRLIAVEAEKLDGFGNSLIRKVNTKDGEVVRSLWQRKVIWDEEGNEREVRKSIQ